MGENSLTHILGSKREVNFYDKKNNFSYMREIVYPIKLSETDLKKYFVDSLSREIYNLKFLQPNKCLVFCKNKDTIKGKSIGSIEKYWITGEIMAVNFVVNNQVKYCEFAVDIALNKKIIYSRIKDFLYCKYRCQHITFYETINECWIKRI